MQTICEGRILGEVRRMSNSRRMTLLTVTLVAEVIALAAVLVSRPAVEMGVTAGLILLMIGTITEGVRMAPAWRCLLRVNPGQGRQELLGGPAHRVAIAFLVMLVVFVLALLFYGVF